MSIAEYEAKFTELAQFAPHMVDTDYKMAQKFEGGLTLEVFDRDGVLKLPIYVEVLDRALMAEATLVAMKQSKAPTTIEWRGKRSRKANSYGSKRQNTRSSSNSSQSSGSIPVFPDCGRKHNGVCYRATGACFKYAGSAFVTRANARTNVRGDTGNEMLRQRRVFALVPGDVQNTESMVSGISSICAQNAYVLIDSGSTQSFGSHAFSQKLIKPLEPMNYLLSVSTPSGVL
ncbi:hypothetical protein ACSBR1_040385 [Camellia fascicularis]